MRSIATLGLLLFLLAACRATEAQLWSGVLDSNRATDWTQAGVSGGIPSGTWTQCGSTITAFGTSGAPAAPTSITTALTNCSGKSQYVLLGPGTFYLNAGICSTGLDHVELRGSGANQTKLVFSGTTNCDGNATLIGFQSSDGQWYGNPSPVYAWSSGFSKGGTSITLSSGANIVAGSTMIFLDQCDTGYSGDPCSGSAVDNGNFFNCGDAYNTAGPVGCSWNGNDSGNGRAHRFQNEIVQAVSCSPACGSAGTTTVTISPPLIHPNWSSGQTPEAYLIQPSSYVGVRNLAIDGSATTDVAGVMLTKVVDSWAEGIAVLHSYQLGIWIIASSHVTVADSYVFDTGQNLAYSDPMSIKDTVGADNLIQNNIVQSTRVAIMNGEGPAVGDVIAYNFALNCYDAADGLWGCLWQHANGDDYNLYEGNVSNQMFDDIIHGSHLMITGYRNLLTAWESCANGNCGAATAKDAQLSAVDDLGYNRYANWIANVLGSPGIQNEYGYTAADYYTGNGDKPVYNIGSGDQASGATISPVPADNIVGTTLYRWGNYDTFHSATQWNSSEVPTGISVYPQSIPTSLCTSSLSCPASFCLSSKPTWWPNSIPFPAIGPDVTGGNLGVCSGTLNVAGHYAGVPALANAQCTGTSLTASQWGGHANAIPAMACYLNVMAGPPDGTGSALTFNPSACYTATANVGGSSFGGGSSWGGGNLITLVEQR